MTLQQRRHTQERIGIEIRVRGRVQGVGFRPTVWRLARELALAGEVRNDGEGVVIRACGPPSSVEHLLQRLRAEAPPLASIEEIVARSIPPFPEIEFRIAPTVRGQAQTEVAPDAASCDLCASEVLDPRQRRYLYPFANCTHCGPRFSIVTSIPYDRASTTMADFPLCSECAREYGDPADRRFHAEAIACHACGPKVRLVRFGSHAEAPRDAVDAAAEALRQGMIVAIKGLGGYQLACEATNAATVARLRSAKARLMKPFALMARDLGVIRRYCMPTKEEEHLLLSSEAPIVLMRATGPERLPDCVAPGLSLLGFMLPTTPLHVLLLRALDRPLVMTSGNLSDEPQIIEDAEALRLLPDIADAALVHDRRIAIRVDDSVARAAGGVPRLLRRARGYAPAPIALPEGFEEAPPVLAFGSEMKAAFCMTKQGKALLSQHQGELDSAAAYDDFRRNMAVFAELFDHLPQALACDLHPEYRSSKLARHRAFGERLPLVETQHHHAHVAACLAENRWPLANPRVLGIVLDGLGWGPDHTIWGGEFLLAGYGDFERLAALKPVPTIGGDQAAREPWRNLYAHLAAGIGWSEFAADFSELELSRYLAGKPLALLDQMLARSINTRRASSCGRLFDAVAAALGICRDRQAYDGEAAARLESLIEEGSLLEEAHAYPFATCDLEHSGLHCLDPLPMWKALLHDLARDTPAAVIAARFHGGLACAIAAMAVRLARLGGGGGPRFDTVALSGGCFQNATLLAELERRLRAEGFTVLTHARVPPNDGGIALGQAAIAAARLLERSSMDH